MYEPVAFLQKTDAYTFPRGAVPSALLPKPVPAEPPAYAPLVKKVVLSASMGVAGVVLERGGVYAPFDQPGQPLLAGKAIEYEDEVLQSSGRRFTADARATTAAIKALNDAVGKSLVTLTASSSSPKSSLSTKREGAVVPIKGYTPEPKKLMEDDRVRYMRGLTAVQAELDAGREAVLAQLDKDPKLRALVRKLKLERGDKAFDDKIKELAAKTHMQSGVFSRVLAELLTTPLSMQVALTSRPIRADESRVLLLRDVQALTDDELLKRLSS
jgi:hypothetical protein